jgi:hypothetical protein
MSTPLLVLYDPRGRVADDGTFAPLWSSDCRPAPTLKELCGELLMAGWPLSVLLKLPGEEEPTTLLALYKAQHEGRLPKNFAAFQREAKAQKYMQDNAADPYGTGISASSKFGRSDYGQGNL